MRVADCHPERKYYAKGKCNLCYMAHFRATHPEHREQMKAYCRVYNKVNAEKIESQRNKPERLAQNRNRRYLSKYGLSEAEALGRLEDQGGCCAICDRPLVQSSMRVDHCHTTGAVRGILCNPCNAGIGMLGDKANHLFRAFAYLEKSETVTTTSKEHP
jgi:hypothetical protein